MANPEGAIVGAIDRANRELRAAREHLREEIYRKSLETPTLQRHYDTLLQLEANLILEKQAAQEDFRGYNW
jgi:hypothetical protein